LPEEDVSKLVFDELGLESIESAGIWALANLDLAMHNKRDHLVIFLLYQALDLKAEIT
jgi:hypothetical protein